MLSSVHLRLFVLGFSFTACCGYHRQCLRFTAPGTLLSSFFSYPIHQRVPEGIIYKKYFMDVSREFDERTFCFSFSSLCRRRLRPGIIKRALLPPSPRWATSCLSRVESSTFFPRRLALNVLKHAIKRSRQLLSLENKSRHAIPRREPLVSITSVRGLPLNHRGDRCCSGYSIALAGGPLLPFRQ